jgi:hypothetical protein
VDALDGGGEVPDLAGGARVLEQHPEARLRVEVDGGVADDHLDPERFGPGRHHGDGLGVAPGVDEERSAGVLGRPAAQGHGLGRGRGLVEHRRVGHVGAGEVGHHGLEVQQRLEPALADLGLVGRVGRVPGRVLEHVAADHRGRVGAVVAHADQRGAHLVGGGQLPEPPDHRGLAGGHREVEGFRRADGGGHRHLDEVVKVLEAETGEHGVEVARAGADVAVGERAGGGAGFGGHGVLGGVRRRVVPAPAVGPCLQRRLVPAVRSA